MFRTHTNYNSRIFSGESALGRCREAASRVQANFLKPSVIETELTLISASCVSQGVNSIQLVISHEHPYAESLSTFRYRFSSNQFCNASLNIFESRAESGGMPPVYSYCENGTANVVLVDPVSRVLTEVDSWSRNETYAACLSSAQLTAERLTTVGVQPLWVDCIHRSDRALNHGYYVNIPSVFPAGLVTQHLTGNLFSDYEACVTDARGLEHTLLLYELTPTSSFCYKEDSMYREKISYVTSVYNRMDTTSGGPYVTAEDCNHDREAMVISLERRRRRVVHSYCEPGATYSYRVHHMQQRRMPL